MLAALLLARSVLRRSWRGALVLALLTGLVGGAVLAVVDGVGRAGRALPRFLEAARWPDLYVVLPGGDDGTVAPADIERLEALPGVELAAHNALLLLVPLDIELPVGGEFTYAPYVSIDGRSGLEIEVPLILEGRRADPAEPDEIVLSESAAAALGVGVGEVTRFRPLMVDDEQVADDLVIELEVVGIGRFVGDLKSGDDLDEASIFGSPAMYERYGPTVGALEGVFAVRLEPGSHAAFLDAFADAFGGLGGAESEEHRLVSLDRAVDTEQVALAALAVVAALAGGVAATQALTRFLSTMVDDAPTLRAFGLPTSALRWVGVAAAAPAALLGATLAVVGAVVASPMLPIGVARRADPVTGISAEPLVLVPGALAITVLVAGLAALRMDRIVRSAADPHRRGRQAGTPTMGVASWLPLGARIGVQMAFASARSSTGIPVRTALVGGVAGTIVILATLTATASLDRLVASPDRYGWNWDVTVHGPETVPYDDVLDALAEDPRVSALATVHLGYARVESDFLLGVGFEGSGAVTPTVLDGRPPLANDEVALATATMRSLGVSIGDTVRVGPDAARHELRVVGRIVMPRIDNDTPGRGFALAGDLRRFDPLCWPELFACERAAVRFAHGIDRTAAADQLEADGFLVHPAGRPADVETLVEVRSVPVALGAILAAVAGLALADALVTSVRRRRHDLAVLRTLGFVGHQVRGVVAWQATTVAAVSLIIGVPLGLAAGGWGWAAVAHSIGVAEDARVPVVATGLVVLATLALANLAAARPARLAARGRPGPALRTE